MDSPHFSINQKLHKYCVGFFFHYTLQPRNIINSTKEDINSLELWYNDLLVDSFDLKAENKKQLSVESSQIKTEGSLSILYNDKEGNVQKIVAIGYFSPGEKISTTVTIVDIDDKGILKTK